MVKVVANGVTIADSANTVVVEGNHYFPPADVKLDLFSQSATSWVSRSLLRLIPSTLPSSDPL